MTRRSRPLMILLGGGRGDWLNFWVALRSQPGRLVILPPAGDGARLQPLVDAWRERLGAPVDIADEVDPFDPEPARRAIAALLDGTRDAPVLVHASQCPKMMAFGADRALRQAGRADTSGFIMVTTGDRPAAFYGAPPELEQRSPTVADYLAAYGFKPRESEEEERLGVPVAQLDALIPRLATPEFRNLVTRLRSEWNNRARAKKDTLEASVSGCSSFDRELLRTLEVVGLIQALCESGAECSFAYRSQLAYRFLDFAWLERAAALAAGECVKQGLLSDLVSGVTCARDRNHFELDLAAITPNGVLLVASCKAVSDAFSKRHQRKPLTEGDGRSPNQHLQELVDRTSQIGGDFCRRLLITTTPDKGSRQSQEIRDQATARKIRIVTLEELPRLAEIFREVLETTGLR